jgi:hypothetical protein
MAGASPFSRFQGVFALLRVRDGKSGDLGRRTDGERASNMWGVGSRGTQPRTRGGVAQSAASGANVLPARFVGIASIFLLEHFGLASRKQAGKSG